jgi:PAS domain S-box-containing protein
MDELKIKIALEYANNIIATLNEPFLVLDEKLQVISVNQSFYNIFKVTEKDILGRPFFDLGNRQWDDPELLLLLNGILPEKKVVKNYIIAHDFERIGYKIMRLNACQLNVPDEAKEELILMSLEDVTEQLQNQQELQNILDSVPAWVFYKDKENKFVKVNKLFAQAMGMSREELEGKSCFDIYSRKEAEAYWKDDREVIESGRPKMNIIETIQFKKGTLWVQTDKMPYCDPKGNIIGILGFAVDITERKLAEQRYLELLDNLIVGVYRNTSGPEGHFLEVNPAFIKMFEAGSREEMLKYKTSELYQDAGKRREFSEKMMKQGYLKNEELQLKTIKGKPLWGSVTSVMKKDINGEIYFDGIVEDITERKLFEKNILDLNRQMSRIRAVMLNDMQQQLSDIKSNTGQINKLLIAGEHKRIKPAVDAIEDSVNQILNLFEQQK